MGRNGVRNPCEAPVRCCAVWLGHYARAIIGEERRESSRTRETRMTGEDAIECRNPEGEKETCEGMEIYKPMVSFKVTCDYYDKPYKTSKMEFLAICCCAAVIIVNA